MDMGGVIPLFVVSDPPSSESTHNTNKRKRAFSWDEKTGVLAMTDGAQVFVTSPAR